VYFIAVLSPSGAIGHLGHSIVFVTHGRFFVAAGFLLWSAGQIARQRAGRQRFYPTSVRANRRRLGRSASAGPVDHRGRWWGGGV